MDIEKDYSCMEKNSVVFSKNIENEQDFQEALPAYCDDIYRVVKCVARSCITSCDINYNEVKISGKSFICVTYYNENSNLCFADFEEEFTNTVSLDNLSDEAFADASVYDKYTNFRVINQRRIDVHASSCVRLCVYDKTKCPCISSCSDSKLKTVNVKTANIFATNITKLEFDESFNVPSDSKPIKRIISRTALANVSETKIIKDKALIKGLVSIIALYTTDSENEEIERAEYSFSVSKIIDVSGIDENDISISTFNLGNIYLKAKASSGDKLNVIDVFGEIYINTLFLRENNESFITDGYVIGKSSECSFSDYKCLSDGSFLNECRLVNVGVDLSGEVKEVLELDVDLTPTVLRNSKLTASATVNAICKNDSGDLLSINTSTDIDFNLKEYEDAVAEVELQSFDYTLNPNGRIDLRLNVVVSAYGYNNKNIRSITRH